MSRREETQVNHQSNKSVAQFLTPGMYFHKKPISFSSAISYLARPKLSDGPTGGRSWVMVIRTPSLQQEPDLDSLCEEVSEQIFRRMAQDIIRQEKEEVHPKQKKTKQVGSWDT